MSGLYKYSFIPHWLYQHNSFHLSCPHSHCHHHIYIWMKYIVYHCHIWTGMKNIELKWRKYVLELLFGHYRNSFIPHWVYLYNSFHLNCPHSHRHHHISNLIEYISYHWHIWTVLKNIELKWKKKVISTIFF